MDTEFKEYVEEVAAEVARERRVTNINTHYIKAHATIEVYTDTAKIELVVDAARCIFARAVDKDDCVKMAKWYLEDSHPKIVRLMVEHLIDFMDDMQYWFDG